MAQTGYCPIGAIQKKRKCLQLLYQSKVQADDDTGRIVRKLIGIAPETNVVSEVVEIAFVADVRAQTTQGDVDTSLIAKGHLFKLLIISIDLEKFRLAVQEIMADRACHSTYRSEFEASQHRDVKRVMIFPIDSGSQIALFDGIVHFVGVEYYLGL